jgi:hypothetical protein
MVCNRVGLADNSTNPTSELRAFFNSLLSAMSIGSPSPTLSGILGSDDNDVIVTTSSQFWNLFPLCGVRAPGSRPDAGPWGRRFVFVRSIHIAQLVDFVLHGSHGGREPAQVQLLN